MFFLGGFWCVVLPPIFCHVGSRKTSHYFRGWSANQFRRRGNIHIYGVWTRKDDIVLVRLRKNRRCNLHAEKNQLPMGVKHRIDFGDETMSIFFWDISPGSRLNDDLFFMVWTRKSTGPLFWSNGFTDHQEFQVVDYSALMVFAWLPGITILTETPFSRWPPKNCENPFPIDTQWEWYMYLLIYHIFKPVMYVYIHQSHNQLNVGKIHHIY